MPLLGGAVLAGAVGGVVFGALGLVAMLPFLLGLRRRFGGWLAPSLAAALFTVVFLVSTVFIGPLIRGAVTTGADSHAAPHASARGH